VFSSLGFHQWVKIKIQKFFSLFCFASFFENEHRNLNQRIMSGRGKGKSSKKAVSRSAKAGLQFPVGRIARYAFFYVSFFLTTHGLGFFCVPLNHFQKKMNPLRLFSTMVGMMMMMMIFDPLTRKYPSLSLSLFFLTTSIERTDTSRLANSPLALVPAPRSTWPRFWNT